MDPGTGLQDVEFPDQMPADLDITNQSSPGATEENMPGLLPAVDFSVDMMYDVGSEWDTALESLNARDASTGAKELHLLEICVGTGTGKKTRTFLAYLKDYKPRGPIKGNVAMRATWRLMSTVAE
ncbi:phage tail protein [Roseicitreum antarcticum]|uniref:hypothetical protein n=1 Tax=Roseicitreum antarcticum TaxID=564137 RepID=UPI0016802C89|nr:hypothetical protein [Roseicitreum antarcticum]